MWRNFQWCSKLMIRSTPVMCENLTGDLIANIKKSPKVVAKAK